MVKKTKKQGLVKHSKKTRVMEFHHQKPRHLVTLKEFLPSWFRAKTVHVNLESLCFNTGKEGAKGKNLLAEVPPSFEKPTEPLSQEALVYDTKFTFTNNDLLLGETLHNCPLHMVGQALGKKINRILINEGSGVNILPIRTMMKHDITIDELAESHLTIQGFNQGGQRVLGSIKLEIRMDDFRSNTLMHVIDVKTFIQYITW